VGGGRLDLVTWPSGRFVDDVVSLDEPRGIYADLVADDGPPGRCLVSAQAFFSGDTSAITPCSAPHWGELSGYAPLGPPTPYPGDDQVAALAGFACDRVQTGQRLPVTVFTSTALYPDEDRWNAAEHGGDLYVSCAVHGLDGTPLPPGTHTDPGRPGPDQPAVMDLYGDVPRDSAPRASCVATEHSVDSDIHSVPIVTCDRPHWAEVLGYPTISPPGAPYPGGGPVAAVAEAACRELVAAHSLRPGMTTTAEWPDQGFWQAQAAHGVHVVCLATRVDGQTFSGPAQ
jgi:hypothetical protein